MHQSLIIKQTQLINSYLAKVRVQQQQGDGQRDEELVDGVVGLLRCSNYYSV